MDIGVAVLCGYLLGSIPFGLIVSRLARGVDVREYGSGKTGFTNSLRILGLRRSLVVFIADFAKGLAAALIPLAFSDDPWARSLGGLAAVAGHVWPLFAGLRGGRGVLAGAGVLTGLDPLAMLAVLPVAGAVMYGTRIMSVTSLAAAAAAAILFVALAAVNFHPWAYAAVAVVGVGLIMLLHRENIERLRAGVEPKLGQGGQRRAAT